MKASTTVLIFLVSLVSVVSCKAAVKRGMVAMKMSDQQAHISLGSDQVLVGDTIELFYNTCTNDAPRGKSRVSGAESCEITSGGPGKVLEVLNRDYSLVQFPAGTKYTVGDVVQRYAY